MAEHVKELEKMTASNLAKLVNKVGWLVHLQARSSLVLPPDTIWFEIAAGQDNARSTWTFIPYTMLMLLRLEQIYKLGVLDGRWERQRDMHK